MKSFNIPVLATFALSTACYVTGPGDETETPSPGSGDAGGGGSREDSGNGGGGSRPDAGGGGGGGGGTSEERAIATLTAAAASFVESVCDADCDGVTTMEHGGRDACIEYYSEYYSSSFAAYTVEEYGSDCALLLAGYFECLSTSGRCETYEYNGYSYETFGADSCESIYDEFDQNCAYSDYEDY